MTPIATSVNGTWPFAGSAPARYPPG